MYVIQVVPVYIDAFSALRVCLYNCHINIKASFCISSIAVCTWLNNDSESSCLKQVSAIYGDGLCKCNWLKWG